MIWSFAAGCTMHANIADRGSDAITSQADQLLKGIQIMVAEDDFFLALDLIIKLEGAGAAVIGPARNLNQALTLASTAAVTAAVLDVNLGKEHVFPAAQLLTERGVCVVFYTGYPEIDALRRDFPDARIVIKPAPAEFLIGIISEAHKTFARRDGAIG